MQECSKKWENPMRKCIFLRCAEKCRKSPENAGNRLETPENAGQLATTADEDQWMLVQSLFFQARHAPGSGSRATTKRRAGPAEIEPVLKARKSAFSAFSRIGQCLGQEPRRWAECVCA